MKLTERQIKLAEIFHDMRQEDDFYDRLHSLIEDFNIAVSYENHIYTPRNNTIKTEHISSFVGMMDRSYHK